VGGTGTLARPGMLRLPLQLGSYVDMSIVVRIPRLLIACCAILYGRIRCWSALAA
jgi:hypothetical protein